MTVGAAAASGQPATAPEAPPTALPSSRAYWELKAEQMMNRLFAPEPPIELAPGDDPEGVWRELTALETPITTPGGSAPLSAPLTVATVAAPPVATATLAAPVAVAAADDGAAVVSGADSSTSRERPTRKGSRAAQPSGLWQGAWGWLERQPRSVLLLGGVGTVGLVSALGAMVVLGQWNQMQLSLRQERNLLLLERLRELGPANPTPADSRLTGQNPTANPATTGHNSQEGLAPPPEEPWMEQLGQLPDGGGGNGAPPLRVPLSPRLGAAAPAAQAPAGAGGSGGGVSGAGGSGSSGPVPQLVGVVATPGRPGSAIFQHNGSSTSVGVGDMVGSSGWRLRAADGDSAVLERGSEVRRLTIGVDS